MHVGDQLWFEILPFLPQGVQVLLSTRLEGWKITFGLGGGVGGVVAGIGGEGLS